MTPPRRPRILIVGLGRLGGALASQLQRAGWSVRVRTRSPSGRRQARALRLREATEADTRQARICFLTVPDGAVAAVATSVGPELDPEAALVHCAGALTLEVLHDASGGRATGSFHPLVAVSGADTPLAGHAVAVATRSRWLAPELVRVARDLDLTPLRIPENARAAYHAGAALAAGGLVALLDAAVATWACAGIERSAAGPALLALMHSALSGVEARGLLRGLTGPVVRGDVQVVEAHLAALPPDVLPLYRMLFRRALTQVAETLPRPAALRLALLLGPGARGSARRARRRRRPNA
jgi:predicted short-subunit dehydrogenase-like oxidoreductase (DUF2520 family)